MRDYPGQKATDKYLVQRIEGASPEQLVAMLLEGGQRFLKLAVQAMNSRDLPNQARYVNRVADIIIALKERLNHQDGGELVENLVRVYDWWTDELFDGAMKTQPERLEMISHHMGELRGAWEELHQRKAGITPATSPTASLGELSV
jgi:flagellar secretion chaperone FliS